jgi:hypothetical protein
MATRMAWFDSRFESRALMDGPGLDDALLREERDEGRHAVVAQPAGMDRRGHEVGAERVHLHEGRHLSGVAEVVGVLPSRDGGGRLRLHGDDPVVVLATKLLPDEWEDQAREVRAAADAADEDVGLLARHLHLLARLQPDDGLVEEHEIEHRAE